MREILYIEIPTSDTAAVRSWLQDEWLPKTGEKIVTPSGLRLQMRHKSSKMPKLPEELAIFVWSVQQTTYLKVFRWAEQSFPGESQLMKHLSAELRSQFPNQYLEPPAINLSQQSIFEALAPHYPLTVKYFQKMPNGENDLKRVYWWEQRWREGVRNPQQPRQVVFSKTRAEAQRSQPHAGVSKDISRAGVPPARGSVRPVERTGVSRGAEARGSRGAEAQRRGGVEEKELHIDSNSEQFTPAPQHPRTSAPRHPTYDLIYVGGALGVIHAAVMAQLGYRVLLLERLPFGRMNREWNISRDELQSLIDLDLLTPSACETIIAREYKDGFNKFFDGNNPPHLKASVLHTPTVLNVALDSEKWLQLCGEKLRAAGGEIWDETEFIQADIENTQVVVKVKHLPTNTEQQVSGRLLVDAMGTASPIAWQLNGDRAFDSVCPTVGAVIASGFNSSVWDSQYGDVLNSHGDISRGRQLIWELFPGAGEEIAVYLFHYHQVNPVNPGSLLEMYEDFFTILPEYRQCDVDKLVWKKPTFGYIPGHFSTSSRDRTVAFDRLIAIGDAASLQSPLVFTGFGSLIRNLGRLTALLNTALKHDLLSVQHLNQIRAYQSNVSVTWLFSKGMMVPTGRFLPPERINSMLNTFFGLLADEPLAVADNFIKDRVDWLTFNRLALKAAGRNPALLLWIWQLAGAKDILRWLGSYFNFGFHALLSALVGSWFPRFVFRIKPWLEPRYPALWLRLLAQAYAFNPRMQRSQLAINYQPSAISSQENSEARLF